MKHLKALFLILALSLLLSGCGEGSSVSIAPEPPEVSSEPASISGPDAVPEPAGSSATGSDMPVTAVADLSQKPDGVSQVFLKRDTDGTGGGFTGLMSLMAENGEPFYKTADAPHGLIGSGDVVLLFFNCQWAERGGTNTDLIKSVALAVAGHPEGFSGEIVVADNGQGEGSLDHSNANSLDRDQSVLDVVNELKSHGVKISGYLWDDIMNISVGEFSDGDDSDGYVVSGSVSDSARLAVSYAKFTTEYGTKISFKNGVWDGSAYDSEALRVINMPVLKSHATYMCTAAVKNYMGAPSLNLSASAGGSPHNSVGLGGMGEMMAATRRPVLNVLDMIHIGSRSGPRVSYSDATARNMVAASTDPFALDYWAVKNVLLPAAEEAGNRNLSRMSPDSAEPGSFGYWMNLSLAELQKAGFNDFVFEEDKILLVE